MESSSQLNMLTDTICYPTSSQVFSSSQNDQIKLESSSSSPKSYSREVLLRPQLKNSNSQSHFSLSQSGNVDGTPIKSQKSTTKDQKRKLKRNSLTPLAISDIYGSISPSILKLSNKSPAKISSNNKLNSPKATKAPISKSTADKSLQIDIDIFNSKLKGKEDLRSSLKKSDHSES